MYKPQSNINSLDIPSTMVMNEPMQRDSKNVNSSVEFEDIDDYLIDANLNSLYPAVMMHSFEIEIRDLESFESNDNGGTEISKFWDNLNSIVEYKLEFD